MILNAANPAWAGKDKPNLEPKPEEVFNVDVPGYDMRRLMAAEDPLAAANAFFVQIRTVLATTLGIRMCPFCPHCADSCNPCQDAFGSVAELMGGVVGCVEAMFGAVECQKTTGALHYHLFGLCAAGASKCFYERNSRKASGRFSCSAGTERFRGGNFM